MALEWLREKRPSLAKELLKVDSCHFSNRGFVCRMTKRGFQLSEEMEANLFRFFENLVPVTKGVKK